MSETNEYFDYIIGQLKQGKCFTIGALAVFADEKNINLLEFLLDTQQRLKKEKIETPKAQRFARSVDTAVLAIVDPTEVLRRQAIARGFKSFTDYQNYLAKQKGFKSYIDHRANLGKNKFVSRFAALLEAGVPIDKAARIVLPLTRGSHFPKRKLGLLADEAVRRSKQKKLPAKT